MDNREAFIAAMKKLGRVHLTGTGAVDELCFEVWQAATAQSQAELAKAQAELSRRAAVTGDRKIKAINWAIKILENQQHKDAAEGLCTGYAIADLRALLSEQPSADTPKKSCCIWWNSGEMWESSCGVAWVFSEDGVPAEHGMNFCHKCGLDLVVTVDEEDWEAAEPKPSADKVEVPSDLVAQWCDEHHAFVKKWEPKDVYQVSPFKAGSCVEFVANKAAAYGASVMREKCANVCEEHAWDECGKCINPDIDVLADTIRSTGAKE